MTNPVTPDTLVQDAYDMIPGARVLFVKHGMPSPSAAFATSTGWSPI